MAGESKSRILRDAERLVLQGKISQAIKEYLKIVKSDPDDILTLNTIGDLHLRLGKGTEANTCFSQVAENYARNNFLLKAIAVYRKILKSDPENIATNQILASLYARHGSNVDARNQYLKVAEISAREGKNRDSLEAYEKVAELDPMNAAVQLKLAQIQLAGGAKEKAHAYLAGAARAQVKAGDLSAAVNSFRRAMQLNPLDIAVMRGFLETSMQVKDVTPVLEQLKESLAVAPDNVDLHEMFGRACLAAGDPRSAIKAFQAVVSADETRYGLFYEVHKALLAAGEVDDAATCLDYIVPILISRRGTDRAIEAYKSILEINPSHIPTWIRLGNIRSATNDQAHYLEAQRKLVDLYLSQQSPREALEPLELILQIEPDSQKYRKLHREAYAEAFPGMPYVSPVISDSSAAERRLGAPLQEAPPAEGGAAVAQADAPTMVEVDLLLNYGMVDKALDLLRNMEARDSSDREVRQKLIAVYREQEQHTLAAEQCMMLAALHRKSGDEAAVQELVAQAKELDAALVSARGRELLPSLRQSALEGSSARYESNTGLTPPMEVDLSEDLSEIFFQGSGGAGVSTITEPAGPTPEDLVEEYTPAVAPRVAEGSVADQLQEVDFYIRLGFHEEARAKLDEISRDYPNNPELPPRYQQIADALSQQSPVSPVEKPLRIEPPGPAPGSEGDVFGRLKHDLAESLLGLDIGADSDKKLEPEVGTQAKPVESAPPAGAPGAEQGSQVEPSEGKDAGEPEGRVNNMFADLIDEVNSLTDQEIARDSFETHFSLGIAYREMELIDEAIREFQNALKVLAPPRHPREMIQCCGMLSTCFLEKGMPRSAIRWCESALGVSEISPHEALALRYDMGVAYSITGEANRALECFETVFSSDPGYRDIAQKIDELRGGPGRHVP